MTDLPANAPVDLQDERLRTVNNRGFSISGMIDGIRSGDLGLLPVVGGLLIICVVFQSLNHIFLSSTNLVNLLMECVPVGVISLGIVCVLLVGQIDLSVGSVSGLSSAITAVVFVQHRQPLALAILAAVATGASIGWLYAQVFNRFGVPSFVITLAGLLAVLGTQLKTLGKAGSINVPFNSSLVRFAQLQFVPKPLAYVFVLAAAAGLLLSGILHRNDRLKAGLSVRGVSTLVVRSVSLAVGLGVAVFYLNKTRGVGWMFMLLIVLVLAVNYMLTRTKWGKSVFAVGGNVEAARRAGINTKRIYTSVFMLCSSLAAVGGVLAAARLAASNQSSGAGDVNLNAIAAAVIGGTSLFGGRGTAFSALVGIIVIQSISNGLTLLNLDSAYRFAVTGLVLLLAVTLDSVARRSRASHGRA